MQFLNSSLIAFFRLSGISNSSRSILINSFSSREIISLTISSIAASHSGCNAISRYLVTSSASVLTVPSRSTYVPNEPPAATTTAPSSCSLGAKDGAVSVGTLRLNSKPNNSAIYFPYQKAEGSVAPLTSKNYLLCSYWGTSFCLVWICIFNSR